MEMGTHLQKPICEKLSLSPADLASRKEQIHKTLNHMRLMKKQQQEQEKQLEAQQCQDHQQQQLPVKAAKSAISTDLVVRKFPFPLFIGEQKAINASTQDIEEAK